MKRMSTLPQVPPTTLKMLPAGEGGCRFQLGGWPEMGWRWQREVGCRCGRQQLQGKCP